jgi:hypothetical protein
MFVATTNPHLRFLGLQRASHVDAGGIHTVEYRDGQYITVDFEVGHPVFASTREAMAAITPPSTRHQETQTGTRMARAYLELLQAQIDAGLLSDPEEPAEENGGDQE